MRTLKNDSRGTAVWIEREARSMEPLQLHRELSQNGLEAGGTSIIIDGYSDPETGHILTRVTDNGCGMTETQLIERLTNLHVQSSEKNYGVGARIAALPSNKAGLTFASRTADGEAMVTLHKQRGEYGLKTWTIEDDGGYQVTEEVVQPDAGMLDRLPAGATGTAVILHGDGQSDTWSSSVSYQVGKFLSRRYYDFGAETDERPEANVWVQDPSASHYQLRQVLPMGSFLGTYRESDGLIPFTNIAGLTGAMFWWILPPPAQTKSKVEARNQVFGGVGLVVDDEVFNYARTYLGDFGVIYNSVQARVAILLFIDGAEMGTARADVMLPGGNRKNVPWKKLGAYFAEHMPAEIDDLLTQVIVTGDSFDAEMAKRLDPDWMKNLEPVRVQTPSTDGDAATGNDDGDKARPKGKDPKPTPGPKVPRRRRTEPRKKNSGENPGQPKMEVVTPQVKFTDDFDHDEYPFGITWFANANTIMISEKFPPYVREVGRWCEKRRTAPPAVVVQAVQAAYAIEFAATIIDANAQAKFELEPDQVAALKMDAPLYAKALGMQSLTQRIDGYITDATRLVAS